MPLRGHAREANVKDFFKVTDLQTVRSMVSSFSPVGLETIPIAASSGRILAEDITADRDLPEFSRSTMDGYAVPAASTFGASEGSPAYLTVKDTVPMGVLPAFSIAPGEAARISTGGMLPIGCDSVVMIEHTDKLDETTIEVYRSVAPGRNVIEKGEDFGRDQVVLSRGQPLRPQETGLLAAFGYDSVRVFKRPTIAIISSGDEVVPVDVTPTPGQIRDVNTYTLAGLVIAAGGIPVSYGIVPDSYDALFRTCREALSRSDMLLLSGGSSVGSRDFTVDVLNNLDDSRILVHGISISPGKPTILSKTESKAVWGLPGHVVSAMVVFKIVVQPFIVHIAGWSQTFLRPRTIPARLTRNIESAQGRTDFVRVRFVLKNGEVGAEPILGKSGLLNTMVKADGLIEIDAHTEGLDAGATVAVIPF